MYYASYEFADSLIFSDTKSKFESHSNHHNDHIKKNDAYT